MKSLNVSFEHAPLYARPSYTKSRLDTSINRSNKSVLLDTSMHARSSKKHTSFSPITSLAEYNQVKLAKVGPKKSTPDINAPQRVELPPYFNTPARVHTSQGNRRSPSPFVKNKGDSSFISNANDKSILQNKTDLLNTSVQKKARPHSLNKYMHTVPIETLIGAKRRIQDLEFLAQACRRSGKTREEGRAYYSTGVLYDNINEHKKAIKYYKRFLSLCNMLNDVNGEALAYNCLGSDYQVLGDQGDQSKYAEAIKYHEKHRDLSNNSGKFMACFNLGLIYTALGDDKSALINQQQALRYAIEISDSDSQNLALASLGRIGKLQLSDNKTRMTLYVNNYLRLAKQSNDKQGEGEAYIKLGQILADEKSFDDGMRSYEKAIEVGEESFDQAIVDKAKLGYGIAKGMANMDQYLGNIKRNLNIK